MRRLVPVALLLLACNRTSTDTLLTGSFLTAGQSAIELIQPLSGAATSANPVLVWTSRNGTNRYRVQISATADFSTLLLDRVVDGTSYTVQNSELTGIASLDARTYYWRVRVPVGANDLVSATGQLNVLTFSGKVGGENILYVDSSFDPSLTLISFGNKTQPFRSIQRAIDAAVTLRNDNNAVAAEVRVAQGSYVDELSMRANVSVKGGHSRSDWLRNVSGNVTTIAAKFDRVVIFPSDISAAYRDGTQVDGFILNSQGLTPARDNYGVVMTGAGSISNCTINVTTNSGVIKSTGISDSGLGSFFDRNTLNIASGGVSGTATAITLAGSASTVISNNTITVSGTAGAGTILGISLNSTTIGYSAQVNNNRLMVTSNANVTGVQVLSSGTGNSINISNNVLTLNAAGSISGLFSGITSGNVTMHNNGVYAFSTGASAISIRFNSTAIGTVTYNSAFGASNAGPNCYAYDLPSAGTINNNIAFCGGTNANRTGFHEVDAASNPANFNNNLAFDTNIALYVDNGNPRNLQSDLNTVALTVGAGTASGNLAPWPGIYGSNFTSVFRATTSKGVAFSLADPATWEIKGYVNATNGPADIDASGSWSTGDMGANAAQLGPQ